MNLELITVDEQLSPEVKAFIDKQFTGKDPRSVIKDAVDSYKLFEAGMGKIGEFRDEYTKCGGVKRSGTSANLQRTQTMLCLSSARCRMHRRKCSCWY